MMTQKTSATDFNTRNAARYRVISSAMLMTSSGHHDGFEIIDSQAFEEIISILWISTVPADGL